MKKLFTLILIYMLTGCATSPPQFTANSSPLDRALQIKEFNCTNRVGTAIFTSLLGMKEIASSELSRSDSQACYNAKLDLRELLTKSEWRLLSTSTSGDKLYIDYSTIKYNTTDTTIRYAQFSWVNTASTSVETIKVNCYNKTYSRQDSVVYKNNQEIARTNTERAFDPPSKGSMGYRQIDEICKLEI